MLNKKILMLNKSSSRCLSKFYSRKFILSVTGFVLVTGCVRSNPEAVLATIKSCEARLDSALVQFEQKERLEEASAIYREIDAELTRLDLPPDHAHYRKKQSVHAQCLLRLGNMLRQLDQTQEAHTIAKRELEAARAADDTISLARTLISYGATLIATGEKERGLALMEEARQLFEQSASDDYKQGLGWYWILQADLAHIGITQKKPAEVMAFADTALHLLLPIKNWPGVARAYQARAQADKKSGNLKAAADDSTEQAKYQALIGKH